MKVISPGNTLLLFILIKYSTGVADQKPIIFVSQFLVVTGDTDGVGVLVGVNVFVGVFVGVLVSVGVFVGVFVGVGVNVLVTDGVGVYVGVLVIVGVGVLVGISGKSSHGVV